MCKNNPMDISPANLAEPDSYMPALPEGFYWDIQKSPFGDTEWEKTVVFLRAKDPALKDNVIDHSAVVPGGKLIQDPTEGQLRLVGNDMLERTHIRMTLGLI